MARPGERQIERGKTFKRNTGSSPNGVANAWLSRHRGQGVSVLYQGSELCRGILVAFDAYSLEVDEGPRAKDTTLVFKGPGMEVVELVVHDS
jgi:hypothetical protein